MSSAYIKEDCALLMYSLKPFGEVRLCASLSLCVRVLGCTLCVNTRQLLPVTQRRLLKLIREKGGDGGGLGNI